MALDMALGVILISKITTLSGSMSVASWVDFAALKSYLCFGWLYQNLYLIEKD